MNNCIKIIDVSFKYNEYEDYVLKNIKLTINEGEFVCIVGGNGSGKSTLSKLINGIYELFFERIQTFFYTENGEYLLSVEGKYKEKKFEIIFINSNFK